MNVFIIAASPRENSFTLRFATYLKKEIEKKALGPVELIDFEEFDVPAIGKGNFGLANLTPFQEKLTQGWFKADLVIICSPEYNWTANAELFILMDRIGSADFRQLFENKVFSFVGVSSGRGGRQPALDLVKVLSKVISFIDGISIVSPKILEVHEAQKNLDSNAVSVGNPVFEKATQSFIDYSLRLTDRWLKGH